MKTIKTSKLIEQEKIAYSITVSPMDKMRYKITYFLREKKKNGVGRKINIKVESIIEDVKIPEISNWTVKHLGYNTYKYFKKDGFYINFYKH